MVGTSRCVHQNRGRIGAGPAANRQSLDLAGLVWTGPVGRRVLESWEQVVRRYRARVAARLGRLYVRRRGGLEGVMKLEGGWEDWSGWECVMVRMEASVGIWRTCNLLTVFTR
jgi:hypothetical protein